MTTFLTSEEEAAPRVGMGAFLLVSLETLRFLSLRGEGGLRGQQTSQGNFLWKLQRMKGKIQK